MILIDIKVSKKLLLLVKQVKLRSYRTDPRYKNVGIKLLVSMEKLWSWI